MIAHVHERAAAARSVDAVIVATDDERIARAVEAFGGEVRMTSRAHRSGTDRLAEVAHTLDCELIVNVQGDEPLLDPGMIDQAVAPFGDASVLMSTLRRRIDDPTDLASKFKPTEWTHVQIIAAGNVFMYIINGQLMSVWVDIDQKFGNPEGELAVEVEGQGNVKAMFRNMWLKALP